MIQSYKLQTTLLTTKKLDKTPTAIDLETFRTHAWGQQLTPDRESIVQRLEGLLAGLKLYYKQLTNGEINQCLDIASTLLNVIVTPGANLHTQPFYARIQEVKALIARHHENHFHALWCQSVAGYSETQKYLFEAEQLLRQGHAYASIQKILKSIENRNPNQQEVFHIIKAGLLSDSSDRIFTELLKLHEREPYIPWVQSVQMLKADSNLRELSRLIRTDSYYKEPYYLMQFHLWAFAVKSKRWQNNLVRLASLKKRKKISIDGQKPIVKFLQVLEDCYDYERPLVNRLEKLGEVLGKAQNFDYIEEEMLAWAAATRFLWRSRAKQLAQVCLCEYQAICLRLSIGRTTDVFNLVSDIELQ